MLADPEAREKLRTITATAEFMADRLRHQPAGVEDLAAELALTLNMVRDLASIADRLLIATTRNDKES